MDNHDNKIIDRFYKEFPNEHWVAYNKIDGSNLSYYYNGNVFKPAKRSSFISEDSDFMNQNNVTPKYKQKVIDMYNYIKDNIDGYFCLVVCGEIYGGQYNHPDVIRDQHAVKIQKRVNYIPNNDFICFDIMIQTDEKEEYLNDMQYRVLCDKFGFKMPHKIAEGSLKEMLELDVEFDDPTYQYFNLPKIDGNQSEGVVIKPITGSVDGHLTLSNGKRVIFKKKAKKFSEKMDNKGLNKKPKQISIVSLVGKDKEYMELLESLINENRLCSVLSKEFTNPSFKDFKLIQQNFCQDIIKDFEIEIEQPIDELENSKLFKKRVGELAILIVREYLKRLEND